MNIAKKKAQKIYDLMFDAIGDHNKAVKASIETYNLCKKLNSTFFYPTFWDEVIGEIEKIEKQRTCYSCHITKPISEYHKKANGKEGNSTVCKTCASRNNKYAYRRRTNQLNKK